MLKKYSLGITAIDFFDNIRSCSILDYKADLQFCFGENSKCYMGTVKALVEIP